jgi:hypothetical protein
MVYRHDGNLLAGHKHDWEGISVIFTKDPGAKYNLRSPALLKDRVLIIR